MQRLIAILMAMVLLSSGALAEACQMVCCSSGTGSHTTMAHQHTGPAMHPAMKHMHHHMRQTTAVASARANSHSLFASAKPPIAVNAPCPASHCANSIQTAFIKASNNDDLAGTAPALALSPVSAHSLALMIFQVWQPSPPVNSPPRATPSASISLRI